MEVAISKTLHTMQGMLTLNLQFKLDKGKIIGIMGPSGSGKTGLLRLIAGLMEPAQSYVKVGSTIWADTAQGISLPPHKRLLGMAFQDYKLFPHLNVWENIRFASANQSDKVFLNELLQAMELEEFRSRKPATLSGGQQQRVALARALARKPDLLLLDEPFAAQDTFLRSRIQTWLKTYLHRYQPYVVWVSHDQKELEQFSDTIMYLDQGKLLPYSSVKNVRILGIVREIQFEGPLAIVRISKENPTATLQLQMKKEDAECLVPGSNIALLENSQNISIIEESK